MKQCNKYNVCRNVPRILFYDSTSLTCIVEICNESEITAHKKRTIKVTERKKSLNKTRKIQCSILILSNFPTFQKNRHRFNFAVAYENMLCIKIGTFNYFQTFINSIRTFSDVLITFCKILNESNSEQQTKFFEFYRF